MPNHKLVLIIESGEKTCASEPGQFCLFFGSQKFGMQPVCMLFPDSEGPHTKLVVAGTEDPTEGGWVLRCPSCLEAEEKK